MIYQFLKFINHLIQGRNNVFKTPKHRHETKSQDMIEDYKNSESIRRPGLFSSRQNSEKKERVNSGSTTKRKSPSKRSSVRRAKSRDKATFRNSKFNLKLSNSDAKLLK